MRKHTPRQKKDGTLALGDKEKMASWAQWVTGTPHKPENAIGGINIGRIAETKCGKNRKYLRETQPKGHAGKTKGRRRETHRADYKTCENPSLDMIRTENKEL